jgi:hypothetical protein
VRGLLYNCMLVMVCLPQDSQRCHLQARSRVDGEGPPLAVAAASILLYVRCRQWHFSIRVVA